MAVSESESVRFAGERYEKGRASRCLLYSCTHTVDWTEDVMMRLLAWNAAPAGSICVDNNVMLWVKSGIEWLLPYASSRF